MAGRKPTSFENKLFLLCKELYPNAEQGKSIKIYYKNKYKCIKFPDVLIEELKLIIEFDGIKYHRLKRQDKIRDKDLNKAGYKVLHYRDVVPQKEQLQEDINYLLNNKNRNLYRGKKW